MLPRAPTASSRSARPANRRRSTSRSTSRDPHRRASMRAAAIPVIAGTGAQFHHGSDRADAVAKEAGADACLRSCRTTTSRRRKACTSIPRHRARNVDLPIILYNVPGRTGRRHAARNRRAARRSVPNIVGIKEAGRAARSRANSHGARPALDDPQRRRRPHAAVRAGGKGVVSVSANVAPRQVRKFALRGRQKSAGAQRRRFIRCSRTCSSKRTRSR